MRLLVVKMSSIGDVVQALSVLEPLRPLSERIGWVVEAPSLPLLEGHPMIDEVILFPKESVKAGGAESLREVAALRRKLRVGRWDTALDLQGLAKSALVTWLSGARRRVGFRGRELSRLALTEIVPSGQLERHAVLKYLDAARQLGGRVGEASFPVEVREEEKRRVESLVGSGPGPLVTVSPMARWETKLWSTNRFSGVVRSLASDGARVVLSGSPQDREECERIAQGSGVEGVLNLAGELSLRELAWLCRISALVISTDSGPMHIAAAMRTPVVALFGPTAPWRTGPFGAAHRVVRKGLTCSPCFRKSCSSIACMNEVTEACVLSAAMDVLAREKTAR